jgi:hypothetical protein
MNKDQKLREILDEIDRAIDALEQGLIDVPQTLYRARDAIRADLKGEDLPASRPMGQS